MLDIKTTLKQLLRCPKEFPIETLLGVTFFVMAVYVEESIGWDESIHGYVHSRFEEVQLLFIPLFILTFFLHKVNRWAYWASYLLWIPLSMTDLKTFIQSTAYPFTFVLAAILLVIGVRKLSNRPFAAHLLHVVTQVFFGLLTGGLFLLAVDAIVGSFFYIFGLKEPTHMYLYIAYFVLFVVIPLLCCFFVSRGEYEVEEAPKPLRIILNGILSPAIIIYTVILYAYFIKIAVTWNLPKGGVAYMVMGFIAVSLAGMLTQHILPKRYYDWFYRHFTWIALPPLVMYWIGSIYRIRLYSLTEGRFYLLLAGVVMTLFVFMLLWQKTRRFQLMAFIAGVTIILFTYIPGISAKSIGISCQEARLKRFAEELHLIDAKTGKFVTHFNKQTIIKDSVLQRKLVETDNIVNYLRNEYGNNKFMRLYGKWNLEVTHFGDSVEKASVDAITKYKAAEPIDLENYNIVVPADDYEVAYNDSVITVKDQRYENRDQALLVFPVSDLLREHPDMMGRHEQLLVSKNDSLLLLVGEMELNDTTLHITYVNTMKSMLFRRR